jgi:molecular chaperone GrpE
MSDVPESNHDAEPGPAGYGTPAEPAPATPAGSPEQPTAPTGAAASGDGAGEGPDGSSAADAADAGNDFDEFDAAAQAIEVDIADLVAQREEYLNHARRAQADLENFKKMAQKRQDEAVSRELGGFVERLLPVLDACDAAASQGAADAVEPIVSALFSALEREGLERIEPKGEPFDPTVAEAVVHEPGEGGAQIVADVLRTGYRWQGRLLRPALVKVTD